MHSSTNWVFPVLSRTLTAAICCAIAIFVFRMLYNVFLHPLSAIPGPKAWTATPFFYVKSMSSGRYAQKLLDLHLKYGPVVRVAPNELSFIDSRAWSTVYAYNSGSSYPKSPRWFTVRPNGETGIFSSSNADHPRFRRTFAPAFTDKALTARQDLILRHAAALRDKLSRLSASKKDVNLTDELEFASFDILGDFAFSKNFNCLENSGNRMHIHFVQSAMKSFARRAMHRVLGTEKLSNLIGGSASGVQQWQTMGKSQAAWVHARLDKKDGTRHDAEDLMDFIARNTGKSKAISPTEAENALGDFMIAGTETVASTSVGALYHLSRSPEIMANLQEELNNAFPAGSMLDIQTLANLKLLNAVIDETLRLCPSIPSVLARMVPPSGACIGEYFVPGGTFICFSQYAAYRNPLNFSSPTEFLPQRWLSPSSFDKHNAEVYHPFSIGPRNCIGKVWGLMAVRALLATVLLNFRVKRVAPHWNWEEQNAWFIWEKKEFVVRLERF